MGVDLATAAHGHFDVMASSNGSSSWAKARQLLNSALSEVNKLSAESGR